jgi:hypothetical protein
LRKASRLTPHPIPRIINIGRENMIAAAAKVEREKSFAANKEAAYLGYAKARYISMHCIIMYKPTKVNPRPITVPIQCTDGLAVHAI